MTAKAKKKPAPRKKAKAKRATSPKDLANALGNIIAWLSYVRAVLEAMDECCVVDTRVDLDEAVKQTVVQAGGGRVRVYCPPPD